jgi:hypothetical protein
VSRFLSHGCSSTQAAGLVQPLSPLGESRVRSVSQHLHFENRLLTRPVGLDSGGSERVRKSSSEGRQDLQAWTPMIKQLPSFAQTVAGIFNFSSPPPAPRPQKQEPLSSPQGSPRDGKVKM